MAGRIHSSSTSQLPKVRFALSEKTASIKAAPIKMGVLESIHVFIKHAHSLEEAKALVAKFERKGKITSASAELFRKMIQAKEPLPPMGQRSMSAPKLLTQEERKELAAAQKAADIERAKPNSPAPLIKRDYSRVKHWR